jgi:hypothetical protein
MMGGQAPSHHPPGSRRHEKPPGPARRPRAPAVAAACLPAAAGRGRRGAAVKSYLDGKTLEAADDAEGGAGKPKGVRSLTIKKEGITALKIGHGYRADNDPWHHEVTFLYADGKDSYAVVVDVEHQLVGDRQGFFGLKAKRVVKQ